MSRRKAAAAAAAPEANPHRGEHELELGGKTYLLRPSYTAIDAIERKTEKAVVDLIRLGNGGSMPLAIAGVVAAELIKAGAGEKDTLTRNVSAERIAQLIFEHGIGSVIARLTLCLIDVATGGRDAQGEAKAVAEAKEATATAA